MLQRTGILFSVYPFLLHSVAWDRVQPPKQQPCPACRHIYIVWLYYTILISLQSLICNLKTENSSGCLGLLVCLFLGCDAYYPQWTFWQRSARFVCSNSLLLGAGSNRTFFHKLFISGSPRESPWHSRHSTTKQFDVHFCSAEVQPHGPVMLGWFYCWQPMKL